MLLVAHMTLNHRGQSSNLWGGTIWEYGVNGLAQRTFNPPGQGSNPCAPTILKHTSMLLTNRVASEDLS